jgi:hypothetical protein
MMREDMRRKNMLVRDTGGGDFEQPPIGSHIARCIKLLDLGTQTGEYEGKVTKRRQVVIGFELSAELMADGQPFTTMAYFTMSIGKKAKLRQTLETWRGRAFTEEELAGFDLKAILGAPCMVSIVNRENSDRTKVAGVLAMPKGTKAPKQINESVYLSLEPEEYDAAVFAGLSEYWQERIRESPEWQALGHPKPAAAASDFADVEFGNDDAPGWGDEENPFA